MATRAYLLLVFVRLPDILVPNYDGFGITDIGAGEHDNSAVPQLLLQSPTHSHSDIALGLHRVAIFESLHLPLPIRLLALHYLPPLLLR